MVLLDDSGTATAGWREIDGQMYGTISTGSSMAYQHRLWQRYEIGDGQREE